MGEPDILARFVIVNGVQHEIAKAGSAVALTEDNAYAVKVAELIKAEGRD